jgi:hypothetical protein
MDTTEVVHLEGQLDIYDAGAHHRSTDPATSRDAAHRLTDKRTMMRTLLLAYAAYPMGLTADEAAGFAGYGPADGAWKRVSDLKNAGLVAPTGNTRTGDSGRQQAILAITEAGHTALTA